MAASFDLKVALELTRYFNEGQGGGAYPSAKLIAQSVGLAESTVHCAVRRMEKAGALKVEWGKRGRGHPNRYWMRHNKTTAIAGVLSEIKQRVGTDKTTAGDNKTTAAAGENLLKNLNKNLKGENWNSRKQEKENEQEGFDAYPGTPQFQGWKQHYADTPAMLRELDRRELEGRSFNFPTAWPPENHATNGSGNGSDRMPAPVFTTDSPPELRVPKSKTLNR